MAARNSTATQTRVRGPRWLVFEFDPDADANWYCSIYQSALLAELRAWTLMARPARPGAYALAMGIPPDGARRLIRLGVPYDNATIADSARLADVDHSTIRAEIRRQIEEARHRTKSRNLPPERAGRVIHQIPQSATR